MRLDKRSLVNDCLICILIFLFFRPEAYVIGQHLYNIISYGIVFTCIVAISYMFFVSKLNRIRITKSTKGFIVLYSWCLGGASLVNWFVGRKIDFNVAIIFLATVMLYSIICEVGLTKNPERFLFFYMLVGSLMCALNAFTIFKYGYSGGMNSVKAYSGMAMSQNYFLLGEDNATYYMTWPTLVVMWFYYFRYNRTRLMRVWAIVYTVLNVCAYIYMWSIVAAVACISVPITLILFLKRIRTKKEKKNRLHIKFGDMQIKIGLMDYYWIGGIAFSCLMAYQVITDFIGRFAMMYFNKSLTLSGRTRIWERSLRYIRESLLIGYGNEPYSVSISKIILNHTHNLYLETLYRGGIIGLMLLISAFILLSIDVSRTKKTGIYAWLQLMLFIFLLFTSLDFAFYRYHFMIIVILLAHSELYDEILLIDNR